MKYVVYEGKSDYSIFIKANSDKRFTIAAEELQNFFAQATGITLPIVTEKGEGKYIYLGVTPEGHEGDLEKLNDSGFCIKTVGDDCYVYGKKPFAVIYGTYELLHRLIGWEFYTSDEIYFEKKDVVYLPDFDVLDNPSIEYRKMGYYKLMHRDIDAYRSRSMTGDLTGQSDLIGSEFYEGFYSRLWAHTMISKLLPPEKDENGKVLHPDWYTKELGQMCWTNPEAEEALLEKLKEWILAWPEGEIFQIGIEDNREYCDCPTCKASEEKYGQSGTHIIMINRLADKIEAWRQKEIPHRKIDLVCFAYLHTQDPPVFKNEKGEWQAKDEKFILRDNVIVSNAIIDLCGYHPVESECNRLVRERFEKWSALAKRQLVWDYHAFYDDYYIFIPDLYTTKSFVNCYVRANAKLIYSEGMVPGFANGFSDLKSYLMSKLTWDCNADQDQLIEDFFVHYYKHAAPAVKKFLDALYKHYAHLEKVYAKKGSRGYHFSVNLMGMPDVLTERHWPKKTLLKLKKLINKAIQIAATQGDPATRAVVEQRVRAEKAMIDYLLVELYTYYCSLDEMEALIDEFEDNCKKAGVTRRTHWGYSVGATTQGQINHWRLRYPARDQVREGNVKHKIQ